MTVPPEHGDSTPSSGGLTSGPAAPVPEVAKTTEEPAPVLDEKLMEGDVVIEETLVEPVENLSEVEAERASHLPKVGERSIAQQRESVRTHVTYGIVGATLTLAGALTWAYIDNVHNAASIATAVFTPLLAVAGTVIGFYFGGKDHSST